MTIPMEALPGIHESKSGVLHRALHLAVFPAFFCCPVASVVPSDGLQRFGTLGASPLQPSTALLAARVGRREGRRGCRTAAPSAR